ncbi:MAG: response regulator [Polyangiales bacterium]
MGDTGQVVFVVDDDASIRAAITSLLQSAGLRAQGFASAHEFLSGASFDSPACLVLDLKMPGTSGLDLQRALASTDTRLPIVFVTGYGDIPTTVRAMKAGAVEFLTKPFRDQDLLAAIQSALVQAERAHQERALQDTLRARFEQLTPRQRQVFMLVVQGRLNKQIAAELLITEVTVKIHRGRVMQKMNATCIADLVRMASSLSIPMSLQA